VVERLVYTENVGGSKPSAPTRKLHMLEKLIGGTYESDPK